MERLHKQLDVQQRGPSLAIKIYQEGGFLSILKGILSPRREISVPRNESDGSIQMGTLRLKANQRAEIEEGGNTIRHFDYGETKARKNITY